MDKFELKLDWFVPTLMLFIVLKLSGFLTISWFIVLIPLWYAIIISTIYTIVVKKFK